MSEVVKSKYIKLVEDKNFQIETVFKNKNSLNLVFAFDEYFCKYFAVTLQSLIEHSNPKKLYDIVVFTSDLSDKNAKRLLRQIPENFSIRFFNIKKYISNNFQNIKLKTRSYWTEEVYYRVFIPIIMNKYDRVLFLDSDVIIQDDIYKLFSIDFEDKEIIAISDTIKLVTNSKDVEKRLKFIKNELRVKNPKEYFNAGVLLFNVQKINKDNYIKSFLEVMSLKKLEFQDQDALSSMFYNRSKLIDLKWNLQYHVPFGHQKDIASMDKEDYQEYCTAFDNPNIIHYTSPYKPWTDPHLELAEQFWFYARKTIYYEDIISEMCRTKIIESARDTELFTKIHSNKKIVLWGASIFLEKFIRQYHVSTKNILGIVDKNPEKQGTKIGSYKCYVPKDINKLKPEQIIITILHYADKREKEIRKYVKENCSNNIEIIRIY